MRSWKIAFFVSLTIMLLTIIGAGYIVLTNTILSGHNYDNLITLAEDIEHISKAIQNKANTINEFDKELQKCDAGHWTDKENNIISLQRAAVLFDSDGKFAKIETYYLSNKEGDN
jgi:hypothetical protein